MMKMINEEMYESAQANEDFDKLIERNNELDIQLALMRQKLAKEFGIYQD